MAHLHHLAPTLTAAEPARSLRRARQSWTHAAAPARSGPTTLPRALPPPRRERHDSWRESAREMGGRWSPVATATPSRPLLVLRENDRMRDEMQRGLLREMRLRDLERSTDTVRDILVFYNLILGIFKNQPK